MMENKKLEHWKLNELKGLADKEIPIDIKSDLSFKTLVAIIATLGKYLIRTEGYSVTETILKRELRELGKKDAAKIKEILGLNTRITEEDVKSVMNIMAMILGLRLDFIGEKKVGVVKCPFYDALKEYKQPFMCNACIEYNNGVVHELVGTNSKVKRTKWLFDGDNCCVFDVMLQ